MYIYIYTYRTIWGDSDLRLVAYEIPKEVVSKFPNKHPQKLVNYVLNIKLCGLDPNKPVEIALDGNKCIDMYMYIYIYSYMNLYQIYICIFKYINIHVYI
jgi:hypothetical protein